MAGKQFVIPFERGNAPHGSVDLHGVAGGKIGAADTFAKERIAAEQKIIQPKTNAAPRVAGGVKDFDFSAAEGKTVAVVHKQIRKVLCMLMVEKAVGKGKIRIRQKRFFQLATRATLDRRVNYGASQ